MGNPMNKVLVFTATYNEADNVSTLVESVFQELPHCEMLVVDDNSPDGTGRVLEELKSRFPGLQVIHRPRKNGLGTAHKLAVKHALAHRVDALITMDADFSHHPKYLPTFIAALQSYEFVIASRYAPGGSCEYGPARLALSRTANALARLFLGLRLRETTTSFRGFRRELLERMNVDSIHADGYSYFIECLVQVSRLTRKMTEFPFRFEDRRAGTTKISRKEIFNGFTTLARLAITRFLRKVGVTGRAVGVDQHADLLACNACGCLYHVEQYPATATGHDSANYRCSSTEHASHGRIVECLGCGLVYTNPQLPQAEVFDLYAQVEDKTYLENVNARIRTFSYNLDRIRKFLPIRGRLLEVGSYCGIFLKVARERGYEVMGVEPSRWAAEYATRQLGIPTVSGTVRDVPGDQGEFDIVCSWDVLEHFSDPMGEIRRINSVMRKGGIFAFSTLNYDNWFPRLLGERWPWMMDMHLYYFNEKVLQTMLSQAGFRPLHVDSYCHIITLDYLCIKLEGLGVPGARAVRWLVQRTPFRDSYIPFRFGDIQLFVYEKVRELEGAISDPVAQADARAADPSNPSSGFAGDDAERPSLASSLPSFAGSLDSFSPREPLAAQAGPGTPAT